MNANQIRLTCIIAAAIILMVLFPPYNMNIAPYPGTEQICDFGYAFIGMLPQKRAVPARVNVPTLTAQIACFLIVGGILWLEFRKQEY